MTEIPEQAVEAGAAAAEGEHWPERVPAAVQEMVRDRTRRTLEAAQPYLGVRPVIDREAVWRGIYSAVIQQLNPSEITDIATDAVMEQLRLKLTRQQIDELLQEWRVGPAHRPFDPDFPSALPNYRRKLRNALMGLSAGGGSETSA